MMAGDSVEFCRGTKLSDMKRATAEEWAQKWFGRIHEHYLEPADLLNQRECGFASVTLICSAIEAIGTVIFPQDQIGPRFEKTSMLLLKYTGEDPTILYKHYRCGLVHNGRTNQSPISRHRRADELSAINFHASSEYSIRSGSDGTSLIILNPRHLLTSVAKGFERWFRGENMTALGNRIKSEFEDDLTLIALLDKF